MPKKKSVLIEILCFILTVFIIWLWTGNPVLADYNLHLTALLVIVYFVIKRTYLLSDFVIFTSLLLLTLSSTGGINSPFFFLTYFLLFGIALLFEPIVTLTLTLTLTLFFAGSLTSFNSILQMVSLLFMTPLAMYFGKQYLQLIKSEESIKKEETSALFWLSLNFKENILNIIHHSAELLSDLGHLTLNQKEHLEKIHESAKELLKSGEKLMEKIDRETD